MINDLNSSAYLKWNFFLENPSIATYNPLNQSVTLRKVSEKQFKEQLQSEGLTFFEDELKVIIHELRHYLDHISTYWGQTNLIQLFNTYHIRRGLKEKRFPEIVTFWNDLKRCKSDVYYMEVNKKIDIPNRGWVWRLTAGKRFTTKGVLNEDHPIIFTRFYRNEVEAQRDQSFCRVPFSIGSLLEVNAKFEEFVLEENFWTTDEFGRTQIPVYNKTRADFVFNPSAAMYTVAAHFLANAMQDNQIQIAYGNASRISCLALNIPDSLFKKIVIPELFKPWKLRINKGFLKVKDRGYAFACLVQNAKEKGCLTEMDIDEILSASGLPTANELREIALAEIVSNRKMIQCDGFLRGRLEILLKKGEEYFKRKSIDGIGFSAWDFFQEKEDLPIFTFSDSPALENNLDIKSDIELHNEKDWLRYSQVIVQSMVDLVEACNA